MERTGPSVRDRAPAKSVWAQLADSFFDWDLYKQAIPKMVTTGLPNTLILTISSAVIGVVVGMALAVAGISRTRWLRWPARVYTDIFRGLPAILTILLIGQGLSPITRHWWGPNPYPLGILALSLIAAAYIGLIVLIPIAAVAWRSPRRPGLTT